MAEYGDLQTITMDAAADISVHRYHAVVGTAAGQCNVASLNTNSAIMGVLQNKPQSGERATVAYSGKSKMQAGAAIAANAIITCNASGRAITAPNSGVIAIGKALEAAGADGEYISVLLMPPVRWAGAV